MGLTLGVIWDWMEVDDRSRELIGFDLKKICLVITHCPMSMLLSIRIDDGKGLDANLGLALNAHHLARPA